jgi:hypothetical protein
LKGTRKPPRDAAGVVIRHGDKVRVLKVPDLSGMRPRARRDSKPVFDHILGTCRRVVGFNELGWAELSVRILRGPHAGHHTVWIEPELLRVRRARR